jgi:hypothetical protein
VSVGVGAAREPAANVGGIKCDLSR